MATIQNLNFNPTSISGCALWLDAADSSTFTLSGNNVTQWNDKSGNGRNTSTLYGAPQLSYLGGFGSLPSIYFGSNTAFTGSISYTGTTLTTFVVARINIVSNPLRLLTLGQSGRSDFGNTSDIVVLTTGNTTTELGWYRNFASVGNGGANVATVYNSPFLYSLNVNGSTGVIVLNGSTTSSGTTSGSFGYSTYAVGAGFGLSAGVTSYLTNGFIAEILVYNASFTQSQRQTVEGYLAWKWGMQANLPASHPYYNIAPNSANLPYPSNIPVSIQRQALVPSSAPLVLFNLKSVSGLVLWLDGTDPNGTGVLPSNGASISTWVDKSGSGNNATAGTAPSFNSTGINNLGTISFNGSTTFLNSQDLYSNRSFSIFLLIRRQGQTVGNGNMILAGTTTSANRNLSIFYDSSLLRFGFYANDLDYNSFPAFTTAATEPAYLLEFTYTPGSRIIYLNATSVASDTNSTNLIDDLGARIGGTSAFGAYYQGFIGEMIVLNGTPATTSRQQIEGYLAWKWGLRSSLPASHPYKNTPPGLPITATIPTISFQPATFSPRNISGMQLWLDGQDPNATGSALLNGQSVSSWIDKSGAGNNATSAGTTPTYTLSTRGVTFGGSGYYTTNFSASLTSETSFVVFNCPSLTNFQQLLGSSAGGRQIFFGSSGNIYVKVTFGAEMLATAGGTISSGSTAILTYQLSNASSPSIYTNGTLRGVGTYSTLTSGKTTTIGTYIGPGDYFIGTIFEIIGYNTPLSSGQRQSVEGYLAWKWGLQGSLPATHPFKGFPPPPN